MRGSFMLTLAKVILVFSLVFWIGLVVVTATGGLP